MTAWRRLIAFLAVLLVPIGGTVLLATPAQAANVPYTIQVTSAIGHTSGLEAFTTGDVTISYTFAGLPAGTVVSQQWYRRSGTTDTPISGATSTNLVTAVPTSWIGNTVFMRTRLKATGYTDSVFDSSPTIPVVKGRAFWSDVWLRTDANWQYTGYVLDPSNVNSNCVVVKANGVAITPGTVYPSNKVTTFTGSLKDAVNCAWVDPADATYTQQADLRLTVGALDPTQNTTAMTVTIPSVPGLAYRLNGAITAPGTYLARGNNTVKAEGADDTHRVEEWWNDATGQWDDTGTRTWTLNNPITTVTPATPTSNPATGVIAIPTTTGVYYKLDGQIVTGNKQTWKNATVTAVPADARYDLNGTTSWTFDHRRTVTPAAPTYDQASLSYTIPTTSGVTYQVAGAGMPAGTYPGTGTVAITAVAADDTYKLATGATASWSFNATAQSVTAAAPGVNQAGTSYVIPTSTGVRYKVDGGEAGGYLPGHHPGHGHG